MGTKRLSPLLLPLLASLLFSSISKSSSFSSSQRVISPTVSLKDGETIISFPSGDFELGFRNISLSRRYLAIWYKGISQQNVVWVANRDNPLNDTSGILTLTANGTLQLFSNSTSTAPIWSSNTTKTNTATSTTNPIAYLLDTGNLVIDRNADKDYIWESFDSPGNTFLPTLKFGRDLTTGVDRFLSSWSKDDDPSTGRYTNKLDLEGYPQILLWKDDQVVFRTGPWNGERFSGMPNLQQNTIYTFEFVMNKKEVYYRYNLVNGTVLSRMVLNTAGKLQRFMWNQKTSDWLLYLTVQGDDCDRYRLCGQFGSCNINNSPPCTCLEGFEPRNRAAWDAVDWSDGCKRRTNLSCDSDGFRKVGNIKLPDTRKVWYREGLSLEECQGLCKENCSCTAFANSDVRNGGSGCLLWFADDLIDVREYTDQTGQDLYVRMAASELDDGPRRRKLLKAILIPILTVGATLLALWLHLHRRRRKNRLTREATIQRLEQDVSSVQDIEEKTADLDLPLITFDTLASATNYFSPSSRLGRGGFGVVYKGTLKDGEEIAVKRLSKNSKQGIIEFKNEVSCIAKLQHRNLVKLIGCCIHEEERMLIYEYMSNKSLDSFIFDADRRLLLDWPKRFDIINGVARGLLYLHQDSRQRVIHRDLKTSNILLDYKLYPKISDFGLARMFGGNETEANTSRVVGTYGYMAPEYIVDGVFSLKSDVFSFGVLVLEIVTGKKNRGFSHPDHNHNLLGHAWRLYKGGRSVELMDECYKDTCVLPEVLRCIHVGLLCVQQSPGDRPDMYQVTLMLGSSTPLDEPRQPGFFTERRFNDPASSPEPSDTTENQLTITLLDPR